MSKPQLLAIVGPTGSGKTALAIAVAQQYDGEIICADSRTVYRGMDIGTAKPTKAEQQRVPHHMLDIVDPAQRFTVADFTMRTTTAIDDIRLRGKLPIVVGGSGLYVDALLYGFNFRPQGSEMENQALDRLSDDELQHRVKAKGIDLNPSDLKNRRRLERALIAGIAAPQPRKLPANHYIIGLNPGLEELELRIADRTDAWFKDDIISETQRLFGQFGEIEALNTPPYREIWQHITQERGLVETKKLINLHLRQLARRQLTWFKRNPEIHWASSSDEAEKMARQITTQI